MVVAQEDPQGALVPGCCGGKGDAYPWAQIVAHPCSRWCVWDTSVAPWKQKLCAAERSCPPRSNTTCFSFTWVAPKETGGKKPSFRGFIGESRVCMYLWFFCCFVYFFNIRPCNGGERAAGKRKIRMTRVFHPICQTSAFSQSDQSFLLNSPSLPFTAIVCLSKSVVG